MSHFQQWFFLTQKKISVTEPGNISKPPNKTTPNKLLDQYATMTDHWPGIHEDTPGGHGQLTLLFAGLPVRSPVIKLVLVFPSARNYCNRVFSDQSSIAVCKCLYRGSCYFSRYKTNQLTGNVYNDSEVTIKVKEDIRSCYAKYVFFLGKINNVIVSLFLLGLFTDRNDAFSYPFIYFS